MNWPLLSVISYKRRVCVTEFFIDIKKIIRFVRLASLLALENDYTVPLTGSLLLVDSCIPIVLAGEVTLKLIHYVLPFGAQKVYRDPKLN